MEQKPLVIFIVGNSRTGTTMMSRILGMHPEIYSFHELHFFEHIVPIKQISRDATVSQDTAIEMAEKLIFAQRDGVFSHFQPGKYREESLAILGNPMALIPPVEIFERFCQWYVTQEGKSIACEQTPRNIYYAQELLQAMPTAVFINMIRDPRDVLLSQKKRWRRRFLGAKNVPWFRETIRSYMNYHPIAMAKLWQSSVQAASKLNSPRFLTVRFEALLQNPNAILLGVCEFLGVPYDARMLEIERVGSSSITDNKTTRGIDSARSGQWRSRLSHAEIHICQSIAGTEMKKLGYDEIDVYMPKLYWGWFWGTLLVKMGIALVLNIHRTRNLYQSFRRRFVTG